MPGRRRKVQKKSRGRPREFNEEDALGAAMRVFADKGYEAASLTDLTKAMGINRFSMYATFGNKESLFRKAMERFTRLMDTHLEVCLATGTAREAVEKIFHQGILMHTDPNAPGACFVTQGPLSSRDASAETREFVACKRLGGQIALQRRFERAIEEGELPRTVSAEDLAAFYSVVIQGLALQAQHGGSREQLQRVADVALNQWPKQQT
jgi:AcrR family transcriptional regulator